eukprot:442490-Pelagomonas_calceolata.AAC.1
MLRTTAAPQTSRKGVQCMDAPMRELQVASLYNVSSDDVLRLQNVIGKGAWGTVYKGQSGTAFTGRAKVSP